MTRLGILLSGRGSNFIAIAEAIASGHIPGAEIAAVISNLAAAPGLSAARQRGLPAYCIPLRGRSRVEHDFETMARLQEQGVELVCLAGYMRLLSAEFVHSYSNRILNIHPSLLPAFPGLDAQRQALEYGVEVSGCTVHFVDAQLDHGIVVLQRHVPVLPEDDEGALAARILKEEHLAYPEAIMRVTSGRYEVVGRRYVLRRQVDRSMEAATTVL